MGVGTSIVVFAIGAIMRFAVSVQTHGFNIHTVGVILMIVGAVAFLLSLAFWGSWGGFGTYRRDRTVVRDSSRPRYRDDLADRDVEVRERSVYSDRY